MNATIMASVTQVSIKLGFIHEYTHDGVLLIGCRSRRVGGPLLVHDPGARSKALCSVLCSQCLYTCHAFFLSHPEFLLLLGAEGPLLENELAATFLFRADESTVLVARGTTTLSVSGHGSLFKRQRRLQIA
jgi:hypothetical protein